MVPTDDPSRDQTEGLGPFFNTTMPAVTRDQSGLPRREGFGRRSAGTLEMWVCSSCGYVEWYAQQMRELTELLTALSRIPPSGVRFHDGGDSASPYR